MVGIVTVGGSAGIRETVMSQNASGSTSVVAPTTSGAVLNSDGGIFRVQSSKLNEHGESWNITEPDGSAAAGCVYTEQMHQMEQSSPR